MYLFHVLCALMCVTAVLTLSTKKEIKLDRETESDNNSSSTKAENTLDPKFQNVSKVSAERIVSPEKIKKVNVSKLSPPTMEGGGKFTNATPPLRVEEVSVPPSVPKEVSSSMPKSAKEGIQIERAVSPRKEAVPIRYNIKPRKGVGNETGFNEADSSSEDFNIKLKDHLNPSSALPFSSNETLKDKTQKIEIPTVSTTKHIPSSETSVSETPQKMSTEKMKKHKLKPTVTIGGSNVDEPIPASPTKTPPLGMPRKIDYIVPVMITIFALPLLGITSYVLYRRGRDCWDKRHYRRMDFLIDGMYNE